MKPGSSILLLFTLSHALLCQSSGSPFRSGWDVDAVPSGLALGTAAAAVVIGDPIPVLTPEEIRRLEKRSVNPVDRFSAGWYSRDQDLLSDILVGGSIVSPLLLFADEGIRRDAGTISVMYLETVLLAAALPSFGKGTVRRARPFVYGSPAPMSEKEHIDALRSFFSRHATLAFATTTFFAQVYTAYHPESHMTTLVWSGAIGLASTVSLLRVTSGAHFLSDVAVGAAVGAAVGTLVPMLHRIESESISLLPYFHRGSAGAILTLHLK